MNKKIIRALVAAAYERGWRNACDDHIQQDNDPHHPIGQGKRDLDTLLSECDPYNLLGLRG